MLKEFNWQYCRVCGMAYQPVAWMPWRTVGFCREMCMDLHAIARSPDGVIGRPEIEPVPDSNLDLF